MEKETWKAGNMLYPLPAVMVSVSDGEGNDNMCDRPVFLMTCSERRENL